MSVEIRRRLGRIRADLDANAAIAAIRAAMTAQVGGGRLPAVPADEAGAAVPGPRVTLLTRPGCHLCQDARAVVERVCAQAGAAWAEVDITGDQELLRRWTDDVPVTFVDGRHIDSWRVSATRLRAALDG